MSSVSQGEEPAARMEASASRERRIGTPKGESGSVFALGSAIRPPNRNFLHVHDFLWEPSRKVKIFAHMLKKVAISFPFQGGYEAVASQNPVRMGNFVAPESTCSGS